MKNTKILFIRLYIETLYSNFIVPLRGSNYIQLLYGDFKERLDFFFMRTRRLVWQRRTNGLDQNMAETWLEIGQNLIKTWSGFEAKRLHQRYTKDTPEISADRGKSVQFLMNPGIKVWANEGSCGQKIGTDRDTSGRNSSLKCYQMRPNATKKQGDQRRLKATRIRVTRSDQRCPENEVTTYHYLILPNNLFMFCVGQKNL